MNYIREATEYLRNYQNLKIAVSNLSDKLKELRASLDGLNAIEYSDMPKGSRKEEPDERVCNIIFERDQAESQLLETKKALIKMNKILKNLPEEERKAIELSFDIKETGDAIIADELGVSRDKLYRLRREGIKKLSVQLFGIKAV